MRLISLFIPCLLFLSFAPPEKPLVSQLRYALLHAGKKVGEIKASRTTVGDWVTYEVETQLELRVLVIQRIRYTSKAMYKSGQLQSSSSTSYLNDKQHHICVTALKGNHYEISRDEEENRIYRQISYSGVMLYFREPTGFFEVYSEMSGYDNKVRRIKDGQYALTDSKSKKQNTYWYRAGILDHAFINHVLYDFEVKRIQ